MFTLSLHSEQWSIGKIRDVYFKFAMGGDFYVLQLLASLDPDGILPPLID